MAFTQEVYIEIASSHPGTFHEKRARMLTCCLKSRGPEEIVLFGIGEKYSTIINQRHPEFVFGKFCILVDLHYQSLENSNIDPRDFKKIIY